MRIFLLFILLISITSCKKDTSKDQQQNFIFKLDKEINFKNPDGNYYSFLTKVYQNRYAFRRKVRTSNEGLDVLDLSNSEVSEIVLNGAQMRSLKRFRSFEVKSFDSIYVFGIVKYIIVNRKGETIHEDFFNHPKNDNYFPITGSNISKPFIINNSFFMTKIIDMSPSNELYSSNTLLKFNFADNKINEMKNTSYPNIYFDKCWVSLDLDVSNTYCENLNSIIYSYPIDDNLYLYDIITNQKKVIESKKSQFKTSRVKAVYCKDVWDVPTYHKHSYDNFLYGDIIYDKFKKIYYRICYPKTKDANYSKQFNSSNKKFSIMVYNKDLDLIYESKIFNDKPKYISFDYFVDKRGLWVSKNNPDNEEYEENTLTFQLFNFSKNEEK